MGTKTALAALVGVGLLAVPVWASASMPAACLVSESERAEPLLYQGACRSLSTAADCSYPGLSSPAGLLRPYLAAVAQGAVLTEVPYEAIDPATSSRPGGAPESRDLPALPGAFSLVLFGFFYVTLVRNRRRYVAAAAILVAAGQAGVRVLPRIAGCLESSSRLAMSATGWVRTERWRFHFGTYTPEIHFVGLLRRVLAGAAGDGKAHVGQRVYHARNFLAVANAGATASAAVSFLA